jgi:hypothetical protein
LHQWCGTSLVLATDLTSDSAFFHFPDAGVFGFECPIHDHRKLRIEAVP